MSTKAEEYWRSRGIENKYLKVESWRVVVRLMRMYVNPSSSILELGCNSGLTLFQLWERGFMNLAGVEINPEAVRALRTIYPALRDIPIWESSIVDVLPELPRFDVIFSKATLCHLPYRYEWVLKQIAKRAKRYIITVENELTFKETEGNRHFARNYEAIFSRWGFKAIHKINPVPDMNAGYVARVLIRASLQK